VDVEELPDMDTMRRALLLAGSAGLFLTAACSDLVERAQGRDDETERDEETGEVVEAGEVDAFEVHVGDCLLIGGQTGEDVESVPAVPCQEPHDFEVFALVQLDDGPYPGSTVIDEQGLERCVAEFEAYVGKPYAESEFTAVPFLVPSAQSWTMNNDREVVCALGIMGQQLTGSMRGSAR
jgi:hypothetical protein